MQIAGIRIGTARAGIKSLDRDDLTLFELAPGSVTAAVFTRNAFCAAPVTLAQEHLASIPPRYLVINSGNANAGTGPRGYRDAQAVCVALGQTGDCEAEAVLPFSTGVIGEPMPVDRIVAAIPEALAALDVDQWSVAAHAIMTTDTVPKLVTRRIDVLGHRITVTGIAKGAGMIQPNMATMLAFIGTDAALSPELAQHCLSGAVEGSFNRITVDGDTSTNDACVLVATGQSRLPRLETTDGFAYQAVQAAVHEVCLALAQAIVRDGEGATKFITIDVRQAANADEALTVARSVANSPLVKTAFFASDPNWGRILAAVGKCTLPDFDIGNVNIFLDEVCIVRGGGRAGDYTEARGKLAMAKTDIPVRIELGRGTSATTVWTCDFSYDYVRINAEYRS
jgi:glutamate N-acetyltransferase / amino-acid N-acetyltransferase